MDFFSLWISKFKFTYACTREVRRGVLSFLTFHNLHLIQIKFLQWELGWVEARVIPGISEKTERKQNPRREGVGRNIHSQVRRGVSWLLPCLPDRRGVPLGQPRCSSPLFTVSLSGPHTFRPWMTLHLGLQLRALSSSSPTCPAAHSTPSLAPPAPQRITPPHFTPRLDSSCLSPRCFLTRGKASPPHSCSNLEESGAPEPRTTTAMIIIVSVIHRFR